MSVEGERYNTALRPKEKAPLAALALRQEYHLS